MKVKYILLSVLLILMIIPTQKTEAKQRIKWYVGYTNAQADIINESEEVIETVNFNTRLKYARFNSKYCKVKLDDGYGYVLTELVSDKKFKYKSITIKSHGFKSYTSYRALTRKTSLQYKLQQEYAYTGDYGIRQVNGRFCIAVGTAVTKNMGQYVDVILENGTLIPCVVADQKADQHTAKDRITTAHNKCVCEFYLDTVLPEIKECGDVSKACPEWQSPVCEFRVYPVNVFEEGES